MGQTQATSSKVGVTETSYKDKKQIRGQRDKLQGVKQGSDKLQAAK